MTQEIHFKFQAIDALLKKDDPQINSLDLETKLKLYGLSKQAKAGNCTMPKPPTSNVILRAKWESWSSFYGMPVQVSFIIASG